MYRRPWMLVEKIMNYNYARFIRIPMDGVASPSGGCEPQFWENPCTKFLKIYFENLFLPQFWSFVIVFLKLFKMLSNIFQVFLKYFSDFSKFFFDFFILPSVFGPNFSYRYKCLRNYLERPPFCFLIFLFWEMLHLMANRDPNINFYGLKKKISDRM